MFWDFKRGYVNLLQLKSNIFSVRYPIPNLRSHHFEHGHDRTNWYGDLFVVLVFVVFVVFHLYLHAMVGKKVRCDVV